MSVDPQTVQTAITVARVVGKLIGGLFEDKDYPFAALHFRITNGKYHFIDIVTLDGAKATDFQTLSRTLQREIDNCLKSSGQFNKLNLTTKVFCLGYASGRPGSRLGSGWFVSDRGCGFQEGATFTGLADLQAALDKLFPLIDADLNRHPLGKPMFGSGCRPVSTTQTASKDTTDSINDTLDGIDNTLTTLTNTVNALTDSFIDQSVTNSDNLLESLERTIDGLIGGSDSVLEDAINKLLQLVEQSLNGIEVVHQTESQRVTDLTEQSFINQQLLLEEYQGVLETNTNQYFNNANEVIFGLGGVAANAISELLRLAGESISINEDKIQDVVTDVLEIVLDRLPAGTGGPVGIIEAILKNADIIGNVLKETVGISTDSVYEKLENTVKDIILPEDLEDGPLDEGVKELTKRVTEALDLSDVDCSRLFDETLSDNEFVNLISTALVSFFTLAYLPLLVVMARAQKCMFQWNFLNPTRILDPADAVAAFHRGLLLRDATSNIIRMHGYTEQDTQTIIETFKTLPDDTVTFSLWLRGLINEEQVNEIFQGRGFAPELVEEYKKLRFFIPPVQDLITMAVREVFTPEVAERFGQFEDFPDDFAHWAAQQGVSEEWARKYWASHWALPSVQMGYEMLHREVINQDDLELLLKSQDVMPFWRDKLIEISYAPYTRVDIRRMHKVGVLNDAEVLKAYKDIGYNQERAEKLTEFTIELNKDNNVLDVTDISELTRSNILRFYEDGIISEETAYGMLLQIGFDVATAALWIADINLREEQKERREQASLIVAQAKAGLISFQQANDDLVNLNLTSKEVIKYQRQLLTAETSANKLPSKDDLDDMYTKQIIDISIYKDTMSKIGYSSVWTDRYIELLGAQ